MTTFDSPIEPGMLVDGVFPSIVQVQPTGSGPEDVGDIDAPVSGAEFNISAILDFNLDPLDLVEEDYPVLAKIWDNEADDSAFADL